MHREPHWHYNPAVKDAFYKHSHPYPHNDRDDDIITIRHPNSHPDADAKRDPYTVASNNAFVDHNGNYVGPKPDHDAKYAAD